MIDKMKWICFGLQIGRKHLENERENHTFPRIFITHVFDHINDQNLNLKSDFPPLQTDFETSLPYCRTTSIKHVVHGFY